MNPKPGLLRLFSAVVIMLLQCTAFATDSPAVPQPFPKILSMAQAISMLDQTHPDRLLSVAGMAQVEAEQARISASSKLTVDLLAEVRSVDRLVESGHNFVDDSRALLVVDKPLYRFGASAAAQAVVDVKRQQQAISEAVSGAEHRISMMQSFFDVLVADYAYIAAFEQMTLRYLQFDDAQEKMEQHGELAEVDVRKYEADYLDAFAKRTVTESNARSSRLRLALALNAPDAYPDQLIEPDLAPYDRPVPDYETLVKTALDNSPLVQAARLKVESMRKSLQQLDFDHRPTVGLRFQAAEYAEVFGGSRDQFRGSLYLNVPIARSRRNATLRGEMNAGLVAAEAELAVLQRDLRLYTLQLVQQLEQASTELAAAKAELLFRELNLDKVRLQYEMEIRARIGSANAEVANAILRLATVRFGRAMTWERIDALTGAREVAFP